VLWGHQPDCQIADCDVIEVGYVVAFMTCETVDVERWIPRSLSNLQERGHLLLLA